MEEIDIIELLKRVKEGKAPKRIEIKGMFYSRNEDIGYRDVVELMYEHYTSPLDNPKFWLDDTDVTLDTKIKILDKPIIKQFYYDQSELNRFETSVYHKIREIINKINKEEK